MIAITTYLKGNTVKPVHNLIGCFLETWLGYMNIWDPDTTTFTYWGTGHEPWDLTTYDDCAAYTIAIALDPMATGFLRCKSAICLYDCFPRLSSMTSSNTLTTAYSAATANQLARLVITLRMCMTKIQASRPAAFLQELYAYMHAEKSKLGDDKWAYTTWSVPAQYLLGVAAL